MRAIAELPTDANVKLFKDEPREQCIYAVQSSIHLPTACGLLAALSRRHCESWQSFA